MVVLQSAIEIDCVVQSFSIFTSVIDMTLCFNQFSLTFPVLFLFILNFRFFSSICGFAIPITQFDDLLYYGQISLGQNIRNEVSRIYTPAMYLRYHFPFIAISLLIRHKFMDVYAGVFVLFSTRKFMIGVVD